jgi:hypothetical protein
MSCPRSRYYTHTGSVAEAPVTNQPVPFIPSGWHFAARQSGTVVSGPKYAVTFLHAHSPLGTGLGRESLLAGLNDGVLP